MNSKKWYFSKTLWFNVAAGVAMVLNAFGYTNFVPDAHTAEYATVGITLINLVLRVFFTNKAVTK